MKSSRFRTDRRAPASTTAPGFAAPLQQAWLARLALMLAALWWGSLTAIGAWVVPMLFANLPTPALAGGVAAKLFAVQSGLSLGLGAAFLLFFSKTSAQRTASQTRWWPARHAIAWVVGAMLCAMLQEFGAAPRIVARENLRLWHTAGTLLYVGQWLGAGGLLWLLTRPSWLDQAGNSQGAVLASGK